MAPELIPPANIDVESSVSSNYIHETYIEYSSVVSVTEPSRAIVAKASKSLCSCVEYVKARLQIADSLGNAKNIKPETQEPYIGAIIIFKFGHVGLVVGIVGDTIFYDDANYNRCKERKGVTILRSDPTIRGYK